LASDFPWTGSGGDDQNSEVMELRRGVLVIGDVAEQRTGWRICAGSETESAARWRRDGRRRVDRVVVESEAGGLSGDEDPSRRRRVGCGRGAKASPASASGPRGS
jgi:hypothetical protein